MTADRPVATADESLVDVIVDAAGTSRMLVVRRGEAVSLRQQTFAAGLGWQTQSTLTADATQVGPLWAALRVASSVSPQRATPTPAAVATASLGVVG